MYSLESNHISDNIILAQIGAASAEDLEKTKKSGENSVPIACKRRLIYILDYIMKKA